MTSLGPCRAARLLAPCALLPSPLLLYLCPVAGPLSTLLLTHSYSQSIRLPDDLVRECLCSSGAANLVSLLVMLPQPPCTSPAVVRPPCLCRAHAQAGRPRADGAWSSGSALRAPAWANGRVVRTSTTVPRLKSAPLKVAWAELESNCLVMAENASTMKVTVWDMAKFSRPRK